MYTRDSTFLGGVALGPGDLKEREGGGWVCWVGVWGSIKWQVSHTGTHNMARVGVAVARVAQSDRGLLNGSVCLVTWQFKTKWVKERDSKERKKNILCGSLPNLLLFSWLPLSSTLLFCCYFHILEKEKKNEIKNWSEINLFSGAGTFDFSCLVHLQSIFLTLHGILVNT